MKHPCGKVFDYGGVIRLRNSSDGKISELFRFRETFSSQCISCQIKMTDNKNIILNYYECGHCSPAHIDCDVDLINVPEINKINELTDTINFIREKLADILEALKELEKLNAGD